MRQLLGLTLLCVGALGCGAEFEIRKDPDLLQIDPGQLRKLAEVHIDPHYAPRVSHAADWKLHSTLAGTPALHDGDPATVAASTDDHRIGEWILIDLGMDCYFQTVRQVHPAEAGAPPRYRVDTADAHGFPFRLQFVGEGQPGESIATFPRAVHARFIRITLIDDGDQPWSVAELEIY